MSPLIIGSLERQRRSAVALVYRRASWAAVRWIRSSHPQVWESLVDAEYSAAGLVRRRHGRPNLSVENHLTSGTD